jgi:hypothetical protein
MSSNTIVNSNIPEYNELENEINDIDTRYGPTKTLITKNLILDGLAPTYTPTPLDYYEVYQSPINVNWYYGNPILATTRVVLVRCGGLVGFCLEGIDVFCFTPGNLFVTQQNVIPERFRPGIINQDITFPIIVKDNSNDNLGKIGISSQGQLIVLTNTGGFNLGQGGFPTTYLSWNR